MILDQGGEELDVDDKHAYKQRRERDRGGDGCEDGEGDREEEQERCGDEVDEEGHSG